MIMQRSAELRKWAEDHNVVFKTTSEIERENAAREREQERLKKQRGNNNNANRKNRRYA